MKQKKFLPVIAIVVGIFILLGAGFFFFNPFTDMLRFTMASEISTPALEQISKGVPVFTAQNQGSSGALTDNNFDTSWESGAVPTWVAFNLNTVPTAKRQKVLLSFYYSAYGYTMPPGWQDKVPATYVIEGSNSTATSVPTNWVTLNTTNGNPFASRQHVVNFAGYNWIRIRITGTNGTQSISLNELNLFDAGTTIGDSFIFVGDSITADWMRAYTISGKPFLAQLISQKTNGAHYPVTEPAGYPGYSTYAISGNTSSPGEFPGILGAFPGRYVVVLLGANDSGSDYRLNDSLSDGTSFRPAYRRLVKQIVDAGRIPILVPITYSAEAGRVENVPKYNAAIEQIAGEFPTALKGPDLYTLTKNNPSFFGSDKLHPNDLGRAAIREAFANWIIQNIYGSGSQPSPGQVTPTSIPVPTGLPITVAPTIPPSATEVTFNVNPDVVVRPFSKENRSFSVAGWDLEKKVLYDGHTSPSTTSLKYLGEVTNLDKVVNLMGAGVVRYSGGGWTNFVGWDRSGTKISRMQWTDPYNGTTNTYDYRYVPEELDSLALFVQKTGMDVMIEVNLYKEDPDMWADMVRYTNVEKGYKFKYWELGNENDLGSHQLTPAEYARRAIAYTKAMKAVDPTIQTVVGVPALSSDGTESGMSRYVQDTVKAFSTASVPVDVVSWHWYPGDNIQTVNSVFQYAPKDENGQPLGDRDWRERLFGRRFAESGPTNTKKYILNAMPNTKIALTELNVECCDYSNRVNENHFSALWFSDILGRHAYFGTDMQFLWLGYGAYEYSSIEHDGSGNLTKLNSTYYPFVMYNKFFGDQLVQTTFPDNDRITVWASKKAADPNSLYLLVTNFTDKPINSKINLGSFTAKSGKKYVLTSDRPASNPLKTSESPNTDVGSFLNGVKLDPNNIDNTFASIPVVQVAANGTSYTDTFAPLTATSIVLSRDSSVPVPTSAPTTFPTATVKPTATIAPTATIRPSATPTKNPSATAAPTAVPTQTPTPRPTNIPLPTTTPIITQIPQGTKNGINLNGNTVTINNVVFASSNNNPSISTIGNTFNSSWMKLTPKSTDANFNAMITSGIWGGGESPKVTVSNIANGTYDVEIYIMEDDGPQTFGVVIEGKTIATNQKTGSARTWKKLGPYRTTVSDNTLNLNTTGGAVLMSGITYTRISN